MNAHRMALDSVYRAGFQQGASGKSTHRHYAFQLDRAAWADGVRDGKADTKNSVKVIADWMARSRPPRR
jgi:ribosome modulation factor